MIRAMVMAAVAATNVPLTGTPVNPARAPILITSCSASVEPDRLVVSASYQNRSGKAIDGVEVTIVELDANDAPIEEATYSNSDMSPGETVVSNWIAQFSPKDVTSVRCLARAVDFTDGTRWGVHATDQNRSIAYRPRPCGKMDATAVQPHYRLGSVVSVGQGGVRISIAGDWPPLGVVRSVHLVPDEGPVVRLMTFDEVRSLYDPPAQRKPPFLSSVVANGLVVGMRYRVMLGVWDVVHSSENCQRSLEQSIGGFTAPKS